MKQNRLLKILLPLLSLLLIPLIAMQFTTEVNWGLLDFVVAGTLLALLGVAIEFSIRKSKNIKTRIALIASSAVLFLVIWAELAVGLF